MSTLAFEAPNLDYHALAPEIVVFGALLAVFVADMIGGRFKALLPSIAGIGLLASLIPVLTLAVDGRPVRSMFGGAYVVDNFALSLKALFLLAGYVVVLLSTNYVAEGDYWEGEYYLLLLASMLGMMVMASSPRPHRIFVALELLSIPAYMLAGWRKRDLEVQRGGLEVLPDGRVRLGGHALRHVADLRRHRHRPSCADIAAGHRRPATSAPDRHARHRVRASSASPSRCRRCRSTPGRPTPTRARPPRSPPSCRSRRRRPASSPCMTLVFVGFWPPAATCGSRCSGCSRCLTMTVGNLIALRQTNVVRLLAYSSVRPGRLHARPAGGGRRSLEAPCDVDRRRRRSTCSSTRR